MKFVEFVSVQVLTAAKIPNAPSPYGTPMSLKPTLSSAPKGTMLPSGVLNFKEYLKASKDPWLGTIRRLTEPSKDIDISMLQKMWGDLETADQKKYKTSDNAWVHYFVMYVHLYSHFPPYYFDSKTERKSLIRDLRLLVKQLNRNLAHNEFDYRISSVKNYKGLFFYEDLDYADRRKIDKSQAITPKISDVLNRVLFIAERKISAAESVRSDKHSKARMFVYHMAAYLKNAYGRPMHSVLIAATSAIFGIEYDEREIRKIIERKNRVKEDDLF